MENKRPWMMYDSCLPAWQDSPKGIKTKTKESQERDHDKNKGQSERNQDKDKTQSERNEDNGSVRYCCYSPAWAFAGRYGRFVRLAQLSRR